MPVLDAREQQIVGGAAGTLDVRQQPVESAPHADLLSGDAGPAENAGAQPILPLMGVTPIVGPMAALHSSKPFLVPVSTLTPCGLRVDTLELCPSVAFSPCLKSRLTVSTVTPH